MPNGHTPFGVNQFLDQLLVSPYPCMQEKENAACGLLIKWKLILQKWVLWTQNGPTRLPQGHAPLGVIHFWGGLWDALFSGCRKREMLHAASE